MLKKFEELNKTIDKLNTDKTKADAQKEVWEKKLNESIAEYSKKYGVDLSGKSFAEVKEKLTKEVQEVEAKAKEDYEKAMKIVGLIQSGDIVGAWKEVGVEVQESVVEPKSEEEQLHSISDIMSSMEEDSELQSVSDVMDGLQDSDFLGSVVEEDEEVVTPVAPAEPVVKEEPKTYSPMSFDDDDDFIVQPSEETNETEESKGLSMEDDEDDNDDGFGGFGGILKGSRFAL